MFSSYQHIYVIDSEFTAMPGEHQVPICLVSLELKSGEIRQIWLDREVNPLFPFLVNDNDLFIAFNSSAEWNTFLALNWPLPLNVVDPYVEFCNLKNDNRRFFGGSKPSLGLLDACKHFGIPTISSDEKDRMRDICIRGFPFSEEEKVGILKYCTTDVMATAQLVAEMVAKGAIPCLSQALFRGRYMEVVAFMEYHGVPVDIELLTRFRANWDRIKEGLVCEVNGTYQVYEKDKNGKWSFKHAQFEQYLHRENIKTWPRTATGRLALNEDTFKEMVLQYPQLHGLKDLKYILEKMKLLDFSVGKDGRNRCSLFPFRSKTGRNQPKASQFIFAPAKWLRGLIRPIEGRVLAYIDYAQQEFGIAAYRSRDRNMILAYESGDPYIAFAKMSGAVPENATRDSHPQKRALFKSCILGTQYGIGAELLAAKIEKQRPYAQELLFYHHRTFPQYWAWNTNVVESALLNREIHTCFGWRMKVIDSGMDAKGTLSNFPMQSTGAEILRVACVRLWEEGIKIIAPVHDAILIECDEENADEIIRRAQEIMSDATEFILGRGCRIRTDVEIIKFPNRYSDENGEDTWVRILKILGEVEREKAQENRVQEVIPEEETERVGV